eukprot:symbB.v1.2.005425.t1/scaffold312.1/size231221/1
MPPVAGSGPEVFRVHPWNKGIWHTNDVPRRQKPDIIAEDFETSQFVEEADQKVAEVKKRDWQLRDRIESLEEHEANTEGQLKWLRSELDNRTHELEIANKDLSSAKAESATLIGSVSKLEQDLKASKSHEEQLRSANEAGKRASVEMSLEKIDQSEAAAEFRKALGDLANDGDDSFGESSSGESVEPVALAPKTRIEAGFRGANGIFIDFVSRNTRSKHPLVVMLLGDAKSRNLIRRRASQSEAGVKMLATYKDARAIINFESLEWKLMDLLTTFWKNQKHPAWITRGTAGVYP